MRLAVIGPASFLAGMGVLALARPGDVVGVFRIHLQHGDARNEVRAVYGGFGLAIAGVLLVAAGRTDAFGDGILVAVATALAGMAVGRLISFGVERPARFYPTVFFAAVEVVLAVPLLLSI